MEEKRCNCNYCTALHESTEMLSKALMEMLEAEGEAITPESLNQGVMAMMVNLRLKVTVRMLELLKTYLASNEDAVESTLIAILVPRDGKPDVLN